MASPIDFTVLWQRLASVFVNADKAQDNALKSDSPWDTFSAEMNASSAIVNLIQVYQQLKEMEGPTSAGILGFVINGVNLEVAWNNFFYAQAGGDGQAKAKTTLALVGAIAGVIGSIPGVPRNISVPARAVNILYSSASLVISKLNWDAIVALNAVMPWGQSTNVVIDSSALEPILNFVCRGHIMLTEGAMNDRNNEEGAQAQTLWAVLRRTA